ncbi:MAG: YggS family pyridoxal phosphate-dependent enzyme [Candidatus Aminicenantes bacterium]|nr:YggS family pyridoxal phosphate-dependent enzyme [Candidatus Aminicenantes bacterium]
MPIRENLERIRQNIEKACLRAKRDPDRVQLVAVCKDQSAKKIKEVYDLGIRLLGENKTQEAEIHRRQLSASDIAWHFIGKLQKNKINKLLTIFQLIESVDGVKSLEHIHKRVDAPVELFIEINLGEEKSKSGFTIEGLKKALPYISNLDKVFISGLMAIPPYREDPEKVRPYFSRLRALKSELNQMGLDNLKISHLSMGMSHDYEVAVEEGATIVRIGTALFGSRGQ